ncbi:MAG: hypothetical protein EU981_05045 [Candidatus Liberibacter ctenarytainae]|uniref:Lysozyme n=1 Tax=Candidatus Liberibacter ctenarytainae TaxID=2020335 RepID=A0A937ACW1_9HYPH|nr:hypothetical protein [Candidatus Liberibacter ctenarytainae]
MPIRLSMSAGIWIVGYGHTGRGIYEGQYISVGQSNALLRQDTMRRLNQVLRVFPILASSGENQILVILFLIVASADTRIVRLENVLMKNISF